MLPHNNIHHHHHKFIVVVEVVELVVAVVYIHKALGIRTALVRLSLTSTSTAI
jgi:hypothetical protein